MSDKVLGVVCPKNCETCEYSVSGRNAYERACFNVSGIRVVLFGPRFVKCNHICPKYIANKKLFDKER